MRRLKDKARMYREKEGHAGGYVIFYNHEIAGWTRDLTAENAQSWMPGCAAYDEQGNCWYAGGGDEYEGAERWEGPFTAGGGE